MGDVASTAFSPKEIAHTSRNTPEKGFSSKELSSTEEKTHTRAQMMLEYYLVMVEMRRLLQGTQLEHMLAAEMDRLEEAQTFSSRSNQLLSGKVGGDLLVQGGQFSLVGAQTEMQDLQQRLMKAQMSNSSSVSDLRSALQAAQGKLQKCQLLSGGSQTGSSVMDGKRNDLSAWHQEQREMATRFTNDLKQRMTEIWHNCSQEAEGLRNAFQSDVHLVSAF